MNIFATGMNPADANALKRAPRVAIFQAFGEAIQYLKDQGEHIEWRRSRVGESLPSKTDAVIVSSMLPRSLNCPYALGVMWTISEALRLEIPLVLYLTDWAFFKAHAEFRSIAKAGTPYFFKEIGGVPQYPESPDALTDHGEAMLDVCRQYVDPNSLLWRRAQVLVPRYTHWGDVNIVQRLLPGANKVLTLDPTPLFLNYLDQTAPPLPMEEREKRWIWPSLLKDQTWLDQQSLVWPVDRFGPKGFPVLDDELQVHQEYRKRIGALCPPYPTVGSGWWRSRWIHSTLAQSVLLCHFNDGNLIGPAYQYHGWQYERMSPQQLGQVAAEQEEAMSLLIQTSLHVFDEQVYAPFRKAGT